jgi:hypothetical protein
VTISGTTSLDPWLVQVFARNGYVRQPSPARRKLEKTHYKKGWEVRLILQTEAELRRARQLTARAGLKPGKAFRKANQWALPVYGKPAVVAFQEAAPE